MKAQESKGQLQWAELKKIYLLNFGCKDHLMWDHSYEYSSSSILIDDNVYLEIVKQEAIKILISSYRWWANIFWRCFMSIDQIK